LAQKLFSARRALSAARSKAERSRAEHRVRVLHGAVILLNHLGGGDDALEQAAKAAAKLLETLGVRDMYRDTNGRGRVAAKRMLLTVMERVVTQHVLLPSEHAIPDATSRALARVGDRLRAEPVWRLRSPQRPTPRWPLSVHLAWAFHTYGLSDDAAVAIFGVVPEKKIVKMAHALRRYAQGLNQNQAPRLDDLCAHALCGAGLLNVKERAEFFGRMA
jgi:hypothetical protein